MGRWLRRVRGAVVMGVLWALLWAPAAVLVGIVVDPDGSMDEMWVAIGAYAGFLGGVAFAAVLAIVARRRRFEELSPGRVAAWGAMAGLLVGTLPFLLGTPRTDVPVWLLPLVVIGAITVLSGASAAASLALARRAGRPASLDAGERAAGPAGARHDAREPVERRD